MKAENAAVPTVEVFDRAQAALYGRAMGFLLPRDVGPYVVPAHDPRPAQGRPWSVQLRRDPFQEPNEPLKLTLASDTRWLSPTRYLQLLRVAMLPGVEIHLVPGLPDLGQEVCRVRPNGRLPDASVTTSCRPGSWTSIDMGASSRLQIAESMYPEFGARAKRVVLDVMLHEASGGHFIVSDQLASSRNGRSGWWLRESGTCSVDEAFRLAGTKARMFVGSTVRWDHWGTTTMNVGLWQDLALQHFLYSLRRSLAGALNPAAPAWEAGAGNHLLAIRASLRDLLIARDAVYRLIRSDSLPLRRRPAFPNGTDQPEAGARGSDLLQLLAYHTVAALNLAYSISDNMILILRWKTGLAGTGKRSRGFARELLQPTDLLRPFADGLLAHESCIRLMALREIRNHWIHEDYVRHGRLAFQPADTRFPDMSVIWLERKHYRLEHWPVLRRMSRLSADDFALITFDGLMDHLWASITQTLEIVLGMVGWSDDQWLRADDDWRHFMRSYAGWDRQLHRALWGLPRAQPSGHPAR